LAREYPRSLSFRLNSPFLLHLYVPFMVLSRSGLHINHDLKDGIPADHDGDFKNSGNPECGAAFTGMDKPQQVLSKINAAVLLGVVAGLAIILVRVVCHGVAGRTFMGMGCLKIGTPKCRHFMAAPAEHLEVKEVLITKASVTRVMDMQVLVVDDLGQPTRHKAAETIRTLANFLFPPLLPVWAG
jgi:hypothetical protein